MSAPADLAAGLARFLSDTEGRAITVDNVVPVSAGARRSNVLLDAHDGDRTLALVATITPAAIEQAPTQVEARVRELARAAGVRVPKVHAVCTDAAYVGGSFLLSERVDGETVPRRVLRTVAAEGIGERVAEQLGESMARLHSVDPAAAPAELPGDPRANPAETELAAVSEQVDRLLADRPVFSLALRWLERNLPTVPHRRAVLHTDMRNGNLIVGPDGLRAVLDWEGAQRFGDPMRDVAWPALRMWRFREDACEIGGFAGRDALVRGYEGAGGTFDEQRYEWWKVLCTVWWGAGLATQAAAHLDGTASNIVMAASGRRVPEIEWDLLMLLRPN
ncbi:phosphotransferase family protein [Aldersonia sp. NBC_00410]|uniref:phosphotransferase family protein n=1 Tax=Aldersonia sp. NBC_00410 TaxID=2975954 RepID=UPI00224EB3B2|nr:phosphotransferase family protein [Aldersonia sp. NBC_00410]MCX5043943.1 phosphotransferase family protein [Aldersonia sp. NBC_00410]